MLCNKKMLYKIEENENFTKNDYELKNFLFGMIRSKTKL